MDRSESLPAAYQGKGWQPRQGSLAEEIAHGRFWARYWVDSEYGPLQAVLLHIPDRYTPTVEDVNSIQHLGPISFDILHDQMLGLSELYRRLGIEVFLMDAATGSRDGEARYCYNLMYTRDLFFMTPEGAILSRMASEVRAGEELLAARTVVGLGIPIVHTVSGTGTFEGADAAWADARTVLIGMGNRTNRSGFEQVRACLEFQGVRAVDVPLPSHVQHLMGVLQIVDRHLAVIRARIVSSEFKAALKGLGFRFIELDETDEILVGQAMNFVTIAPRKIIMVAGNPGTARVLEGSNVEIVAEAELGELLKGAGGLGCATGILHRQSPGGER